MVFLGNFFCFWVEFALPVKPLAPGQRRVEEERRADADADADGDQRQGQAGPQQGRPTAAAAAAAPGPSRPSYLHSFIHSFIHSFNHSVSFDSEESFFLLRFHWVLEIFEGKRYAGCFFLEFYIGFD